MPARTVPTPAKIDATRAAEALDDLLGSRDGWASTDRGWRHDAAGITVEASRGATAFTLRRDNVKTATDIRTRAMLLMLLEQAGA